MVEVETINIPNGLLVMVRWHLKSILLASLLFGFLPTVVWGEARHGGVHVGRIVTDEEIGTCNCNISVGGYRLSNESGIIEAGENVYAMNGVSRYDATAVEEPMRRFIGGQWTFPKLKMRNRNGVVADSRPDVKAPVPEKPQDRAPALGEIHFPTSGSPNAQPHFIQGVLLLHNFEYDDARAAFQQAQHIDPDFAMAYWGEAMTLNHPLWGEQDLDEAREVLQRLGTNEAERLSKAVTDREQGYLHAIHALFGEGEKVARDREYADRMRELHARFPEDQEAAVLYALALLGTAQGERDPQIYLKAASIAESVFQQNPRHPGAVHYLIHAYDDPKHAHLGLPAAGAYAKIAPEAPHALHMPSHIFMALGMWDDVVKANEISWAASEQRRKNKGLGVGQRSYHTLYWLMYAYLQQGRVSDAKKLLHIVLDDAEQVDSRYVQGYRAALRATFIVESQNWDVSGLEEDRSGLWFSGATSELFAIGYSGWKTLRPGVTQKALAKLRDRIASEEEYLSLSQLLPARVMEKQLSALLLGIEGKEDQSLQLLKEATRLEDTIPFDYGPPFPVKPAHELYGEVLLNSGRGNSAKAQFRLALDRAPQRALSLQGLAASSLE